jgi:hypothetical protein
MIDLCDETLIHDVDRKYCERMRAPTGRDLFLANDTPDWCSRGVDSRSRRRKLSSLPLQDQRSETPFQAGEVRLCSGRNHFDTQLHISGPSSVVPKRSSPAFAGRWPKSSNEFLPRRPQEPSERFIPPFFSHCSSIRTCNDRRRLAPLTAVRDAIASHTPFSPGKNRK